jgi:hypothetical protein
MIKTKGIWKLPWIVPAQAGYCRTSLLNNEKVPKPGRVLIISFSKKARKEPRQV